MPYIPQVRLGPGGQMNDTANWVELSAVYTASGGEQYIVIGNFKDFANTNDSLIKPSAQGTFSAIYYLDEVSVTALYDSIQASADTLILEGDSATLIVSGGSGNYYWHSKPY